MGCEGGKIRKGRGLGLFLLKRKCRSGWGEVGERLEKDNRGGGDGARVSSGPFLAPLEKLAIGGKVTQLALERLQKRRRHGAGVTLFANKMDERGKTEGQDEENEITFRTAPRRGCGEKSKLARVNRGCRGKGGEGERGV